MQRFIKAFLRYPAITVTMALMAVTLGIWSLMKMPRTEDPTITIRTGIVAAAYPGATSEQVEKQVTKVLEEHIFKFQEVRKEKTYSTSRPGLCIINVELQKNFKQPDVFWAKLRHEMNQVRASSLPPEVRGPVVDSDFGDTVAMLVSVSGDRYSYQELKDYVDKIKDTLRTVPSVGKMAVYGTQTEQIWITSSLERMSQYFTDPRQMIAALNQRNGVQGAGSVRTEGERIPIHTTALFNTEDEIRKVMVGKSPTGQPSYIGDFAQVERRYQDPDFKVRFDGKPALMISVEMVKGNNIVEMGRQVDKALAQLRPLLPPDLKMDYIANQPKVVDERMADMGREFLIAIVCVILVTVVLLPIRVALIAALAIPCTMLSTIGVMNAIGLSLHQVSIAALILVLGIVVDDAIVIADNYVELLDHGVPIAEAAWRGPTEVLEPVLVATLTIIASFLPLLIISGSSGEFIMSLPITVATALATSFLVAVFVTPLLCRTFIHKGLHDHAAQPVARKERRSVLDLLQVIYNKGITCFMAHPALAVGLGVAAVIAGLSLFHKVPQEFFPNAERNQFVIDVWMPQGSRFEATDAVMHRIEGELRRDPLVTHCASFIGQSSPRFYYNVNPQQPDPAYAQLIVNTRDVKATTRLVFDLRTRLARVAPEAMVLVQELQQGDVMEAPVEYRVTGEDPQQLKVIGEQLGAVLRADSRATFIHTDYRNDSPMLDVNLNTDLADRLGLTHAEASSFLQGAFDGLPVSTFWEGDRAVDIVLRADAAHRDSFDNVRNTYVNAAISGSRAPVRAVADLEPAWQTSRIVRRNGVPTLTVRCLPAPGTYASAIVRATLPKVRALPLPAGYRIALGGEDENQNETFPEMVVALGISLLAIFLILMVQFRNLTEPLVVMASIPLSLFGVVVGLLVTRNTFGFTAFMGMISLCGIVVRNSIILVDFIKERLKHGEPLEEAATQAGERRLRPIFLTTMAAAVGVTPMILSGSKLWSPLASVLAVGLIFSMFFTLLVVPVIYVLLFRRRQRPAVPPVLASLVLVALVLAGGSLRADAPVAQAQSLTLDQAVAAALERSHGVRIARAKLQEAQAKRYTARADFMPQLTTDGTLARVNSTELVKVTAGSMGTVPGLGPFPSHDVALDQGKQTLWTQNLTLAQPLTQLWKIDRGYQAASAEERTAQAELRQMETGIAYQARQVYLGLLIARARLDAAQAGVVAARSGDADALEAVQAGNALQLVQTGTRAQLLQNREKQLAAQAQVQDLEAELNDLMGQPVDTPLEPAPVATGERILPAREVLLDEALRGNPELARAQSTVDRGRSALAAARDDRYIPDLGFFVRQTHQEGLPFVQSNFTTVGLSLSWTLFDGGRKAGVIRQRNAQVAEATEDQDRLRRRVEVDLGKVLRKVATAKLMVEAADEAHGAQAERARLAGNQFQAGIVTAFKRDEAAAAARGAEADLLAARLALQLDYAELDQLLGRQ